MTDFLIRRLPPMANEWTLGLASGRAFDEQAVTRFRQTLDDGDTAALRELMAFAVSGLETANSTYFRFDVETAVDQDEPRVLRLTPAEDTRQLGLGLTPEQSTRKLVGLVVLSVSGDGVHLVLDGWGKSTVAEPGTIVMFPAYCSVAVDGPEGCAIEVAAFHAFGPAFR